MNEAGYDSLDYLLQQAPVLKVDGLTSLKIYLNSAVKLQETALNAFRNQQGQKENIKAKEEAYILLIRFVNLMIYTIPKHPDFSNPKHQTEIKELKAKCQQRWVKLTKVVKSRSGELY